MPEKLERQLKQQAKSKGLSGSRADAYVYGTMRKTGWKPKREEPKHMQKLVKAKVILLMVVPLWSLSCKTPLSEDPARTFYIDARHPSCTDAAGGGQQGSPYCSLKFAETQAKAGDTYLVAPGKYGDDFDWVKSGTETAPITFRADGEVKVMSHVIGSFVDLDDSQLKPAPEVGPHIYKMPDPGPGRIFQTFFPNVVVDDPNQSYFEMADENGPLRLSTTANMQEVVKYDGTQRRENGILYLHPLGNVAPSPTATDFVIGRGPDPLPVNETVAYRVWDGFTLAYNESGVQMANRGNHTTWRNMWCVAGPCQIRGNTNHVERVTANHQINRGDTWLWYDAGSGSAIAFYGKGHTARQLHIFHAWNVNPSTENAQGITIDGVVAHGSPNHCLTITPENAAAQVWRNVVTYNCQDYWWHNGRGPITVEHSTAPGNFFIRSMDTPSVGPIIIRNSILQRGIDYDDNSDKNQKAWCQWEKPESIFEYNIVPDDFYIHRCPADNQIPIREYMSKCADGTFQNCMTVRNNTIIPAGTFKSVIVDGMWGSSLKDTWNYNLVPGSPAINVAMASGTKLDLVSVTRPVGAAPDAGVYERDDANDVDCVVSAWSDWEAGEWSACQNGTQSATETRTRTIVTEPSGSGAACPPLSEQRSMTRECVQMECWIEDGLRYCRERGK